MGGSHPAAPSPNTGKDEFLSDGALADGVGPMFDGGGPISDGDGLFSALFTAAMVLDSDVVCE